jgi:hypothetical protein
METDWQGHSLTVSASFYPDSGRLGEVFADSPQGGQMQFTLADACTLISIALQHGITVAELSKSMAVVPDLLRGKDATMPASPVGAILNAIQEATP